MDGAGRKCSAASTSLQATPTRPRIKRTRIWKMSRKPNPCLSPTTTQTFSTSSLADDIRKNLGTDLHKMAQLHQAPTGNDVLSTIIGMPAVPLAPPATNAGMTSNASPLQASQPAQQCKVDLDTTVTILDMGVKFCYRSPRKMVRDILRDYTGACAGTGGVIAR